jgi:hypothetical protein
LGGTGGGSPARTARSAGCARTAFGGGELGRDGGTTGTDLGCASCTSTSGRSLTTPRGSELGRDGSATGAKLECTGRPRRTGGPRCPVLERTPARGAARGGATASGRSAISDLGIASRRVRRARRAHISVELASAALVGRRAAASGPGRSGGYGLGRARPDSCARNAAGAILERAVRPRLVGRSED